MRKIIASMAALVGLILVSFSYLVSLNKYQDVGLENALDCESPQRILNFLYLALLFTVLSVGLFLGSKKKWGTKSKNILWVVGLFTVVLGLGRFIVAQQQVSRINAECEIKFLD